MLPEELKEIRKKLGIKTQKALAEEVGSTEDTIRNYEIGRRPIPNWLIISIINIEKLKNIEKILKNS